MYSVTYSVQLPEFFIPTNETSAYGLNQLSTSLQRGLSSATMRLAAVNPMVRVSASVGGLTGSPSGGEQVQDSWRELCALLKSRNV